MGRSAGRARAAGARGSPTIRLAGRRYQGPRSERALLRAACAHLSQAPPAPDAYDTSEARDTPDAVALDAEGVTLRYQAEVARILTAQGRTSGVQLADGERIANLPNLRSQALIEVLQAQDVAQV